MALHDKKSIRERLDDEIYASVDPSVRMPKYKFPEAERDPRHAHSVVRDELMLDGNSRQNLATFCQTLVQPEVHTLMDECLDKNVIDKDEYPQTAEFEARCAYVREDSSSTRAIGCSRYPEPGGCLASKPVRVPSSSRSHSNRRPFASACRTCRTDHALANMFHSRRSPVVCYQYKNRQLEAIDSAGTYRFHRVAVELVNRQIPGDCFYPDRMIPQIRHVPPC